MTDAERRVAQAMLVAEGAALSSLRATIAAAASGSVSRRSLPAFAGRVETETRDVIRAGRLAAKRVGGRTAATDLTSVLSRPVQLRPVTLDPDEEARADEDAKALAAATVVLAERRFERASTAPGAALAKDLDGRVRRIAATQTGEGFNRERDDAAAEFMRDPANVFLPIVLRRWNAYLDACPVCRGLNGQSRPLGIDYAGGQRPGAVHPYCRCFSTIMPIPVYLTR